MALYKYCKQNSDPDDSWSGLICPKIISLVYLRVLGTFSIFQEEHNVGNTLFYASHSFLEINNY